MGVGGAYAYTQIQKGRELASGVKAANQLMAAGGDPSRLNLLLDAFKAAGGETGGAAQAAGAVASNNNAGTYGVAVLDAASDAMRKAKSPAELGRNLRVVRPKDRESQWRIAEGCWLPSEGRANDFRTSPVDLVRGLDMGYALTYLPDVYPTPKTGGGILAYPAELGYVNTRMWISTGWGIVPQGTVKTPSRAGRANAYQVMLTSTVQNGVALWNPRTHEFAPNGTPFVFTIDGATPQFDGILINSFYFKMMQDALARRPVFQPFPPRRLSSRRNR